MSGLLNEARALVLLIAANATPVIVGKVAGKRWSAPLDLGLAWRDRRRLLGDHKTWRGLMSGICICGFVAALMQLSFFFGAVFAATSLTADAISSAIKRRLDLAPGKESLGLDQLGETFAPLILFAHSLQLSVIGVVTVGVTFMVLDVVTAPLRRHH